VPIDRNFLSYQTNEDVSTFMQLVISKDQVDLEPADALFLEERNCELPKEGHVFACAFNADGSELARLEIDVNDEGAIGEAADFVHKHAPPQVDAAYKWKEAFAEAARSNRRVWARISQRYCGPCFQLARWLDNQQELLKKDYVMLKVDDVRDSKGAAIAQRLTRGKAQGVPFHAIFDVDEQMLIDSEGPLGNVGHPSDFEGRKQLRKMLQATRQNLTDAEIEQLVKSLED
jgi:hypothetical protein